MPRHPEIDPWLLRVGHVERALDLAALRCRSDSQLLRAIDDVLRGEYPEAVIGYLSEHADERPGIGQAIADRMQHLIDGSAGLRGERARFVDRALYRLSRLLPNDRAEGIGAQLITEGRKTRRRAGYRALHISGLTGELSEVLVRTYLRHGDHEALALIARFPSDLTADDCAQLLRELTVDRDHEPSYRAARLLEQLLILDRELAVSIGRDAPAEFAWAVGRTRDPELLPYLRVLFETSHADVDFVSFYIWALGVCGACDDLPPIYELVTAKRAERDAFASGI